MFNIHELVNMINEETPTVKMLDEKHGVEPE